MTDNPDQHDYTKEQDFLMTLLAVNQGYWLYEGVDYLDDLLFENGRYPFKVRCLRFETTFDKTRYVAAWPSTKTSWIINPDIVERVKRQGLLIEIFEHDV